MLGLPAGTSALKAMTGMPAATACVRRRVERLGVYEAHGDAIRLFRNGRLHGADHLGDDILLRAGPLVLTPERRAGVLRAISRWRKELVQRDMADEEELVVFLRQAGAFILRQGRADPAGKSRGPKPQLCGTP